MGIGKQLNIKITDYCNANCSFCGYNRTAFKKKIKAGYKPFVLDLDSFQPKFKYLKNKGISILHITGGEPFMHPFFKEFIVAAKIWGFTVKTGTNGSLLNEQMVSFLKNSGIDYLWLSLDTFPIESHLEHRGFSNILDKFKTGIELLHKYKINFFGQTVISHVIPKKDGKVDIEGHIDYYKSEFGIRRFVFSYPMRRENDGESNNFHLATEGADSVKFSSSELCEIFNRIIDIKSKRKDVQIVNPNIALWQHMKEIIGKQTDFGCSAGRDIFFLGEDQTTLRPCYYYSEKVVDQIDEHPLQFDTSYETCTNCQDQCFRDPSIAYFLQHNPITSFKKIFSNKKLIKYSSNDMWDLIKNGMYKRP